MSFTMRLPAITAATPDGQVQQMRSYLYQMAQELEFAINALEVGSVEVLPGVEGGNSREEKALENFSDLKSLIISSADIVNAYYEKMEEKFKGVYLAISDFGSYQEETEHQIQKTDKAVNDIFTNTQTLINQVEELKTLSSNAYIRTGELYRQDNGFPVYGVEIGQSDSVNGENVFRKFARFTSEKLSFYDRNGTEVAYVSDAMLNITGANIRSRMMAGDFDLDFTDGIAFKWIGG